MCAAASTFVRRPRGRLLKALATQAAKGLIAHAKNAKRRNQTKLDRSLLASFGRSTKSMDKALAKPAKKAIETGAIDSALLAVTLRPPVDDHVGDAKGL